MLGIILKHAEASEAEKIVAVMLSVGGLRDLQEEWMQRYFDYVSRGTIAEGAKIKINKLPVVLGCNECGRTFEVDMKHFVSSVCPHCGSAKAALASGNELFIEEIEVM